MNTTKFRTKTCFIKRNNLSASSKWGFAIDIGYSAVKIFSPTSIAGFPSYAKKINDDFHFVGKVPEEAIFMKDNNTGEQWLIGACAQNIIQHGDTSVSEASLYNRDRWDSNEETRAYTMAGLAIGVDGYDEGKEIVIQTGLPERYMFDKDDLKEFLSGKYDVSIKIGSGEWKDYCFSIKEENVYVMSQPTGSLFSVCFNKDGSMHPDAESVLSSSVLVFDGGFGTLDIFPIIAGSVKESAGETYSNLGMQRVLSETCNLIRSEYGVNVSVPEMQKYLELGTVRKVDKKKLTSKDVPIDSQLRLANRKVCEEAITKVLSVFNNFESFNYLLITGGTGAAWFDIISDKLKNLEIKIIRGDQNDDLPFIFANVRGYYFYRMNMLIAKEN